MDSNFQHRATDRGDLACGLAWLFEQILAKKRHVAVVVASPHVARHVIAEGFSEKLRAAQINFRYIAARQELRCDETTVTFLMAATAATKIAGCNIDAAWCYVPAATIDRDFVEMLKYRLLRSRGELFWSGDSVRP